jgi:hypothetical protein
VMCATVETDDSASDCAYGPGAMCADPVSARAMADAAHRVRGGECARWWCAESKKPIALDRARTQTEAIKIGLHDARGI